MGAGPSNLGPVHLLRRFVTLHQADRLGGADSLNELSKLAFACIASADTQKQAVAFALCAFLHLHAEDRYEREVPADENAGFLSTCHQAISNAISYLNKGGSADEALKIISNLAASADGRFFGA